MSSKYRLSHSLCSRSYPSHQSHIPQSVLVLPKLKLTRAKGSESLLKLLAGSELLTLGVDTLVVVNKVLLKRTINQATRLVRQLRRPTHPAE